MKFTDKFLQSALYCVYFIPSFDCVIVGDSALITCAIFGKWRNRAKYVGQIFSSVFGGNLEEKQGVRVKIVLFRLQVDSSER